MTYTQRQDRRRALLTLGGTLLTCGASAQTSPGSERAQSQAVDQIFRDLMGQSPNAPGTLPPPATSQTPGQDARNEAQIFREMTGRNPNTPGTAAPPAPSGSAAQDARREEQILRELTNPGPATTPR